MKPVISLRTLRRTAALLLLLAWMPVAHATAVCAGWSASAAERMACCQRDASGCASVFADRCCADGEQRHNVEACAATPAVTDSVQSESVALLTVHLRAQPADPRSLATRPATYLLDSVFRI